MSPPPAPTLPAWSARVVRRLPAGRYRLMNWLCRRPAPAFVAELPGSPLGLRFECDLRNSLAREVFFTGRYEPQETTLVRRMLAPGAVFVDVGAHWGYFSLIAAERVGPSGRIVAVEADPRIHRILERNAALNPQARIAAVHAAVAAEPGVLTLAGYDQARDNWGVSRLVGRDEAAPASAGGATFDVPARPLDALLDERGVAAVDLLKMDIEGAEALAVRGMADGLRSHRYRRILLELHPAELRAHGSDGHAVVRHLRAAGYRGWTIDHSAAALRRAAYDPRLPPEDFLRPLEADVVFDAWPHLVLAAPDVPLFPDCPGR